MEKKNFDTPTRELINPKEDLGDTGVVWENGEYFLKPQQPDTPIPATNLQKLQRPFARNHPDKQTIISSQERVRIAAKILRELKASEKNALIKDLDNEIYRVLEVESKTPKDHVMRKAEINNIKAILLMATDPEINELLTCEDLKAMREEMRGRINTLIIEPWSAGKSDLVAQENNENDNE